MAQTNFLSPCCRCPENGGLTPISFRLPMTHGSDGSSIVKIERSVNPYLAASDVSFVNDAVLLGHERRRRTRCIHLPERGLSGIYNVKAIARDFSGRIDTSKAVLFGAPVNSSPTLVTIPQIQGTRTSHPYVNMFVQTTGVVTAVQGLLRVFGCRTRSATQSSDVRRDFRFEKQRRCAASRGNLVTVCGMVQDLCRIRQLPDYKTPCLRSSITVLGSNHAMPNLSRFRGPRPISLLPRRQ